MRAVTTGPSTGGEAIAPGRQDEFPRNRNPGFRSANLIICGTAHFSPHVVSLDPIGIEMRRAQRLGFGGSSTRFQVGLSPTPVTHVSSSLPMIPDGRLSRVRFETAASFALSQGPSCLLGCLSHGQHTHSMRQFASSASSLPGQRVVPGCPPAPAYCTGSPACPQALCWSSITSAYPLLRPDVPIRGPLPCYACSSQGSLGSLDHPRLVPRTCPTLSLRLLPCVLGPLPRWLVGCLYPFLPPQHRPSPR